MLSLSVSELVRSIGQIITFQTGCLYLTPSFGARTHEIWTAKSGLKKLETSLYRVVYNTLRGVDRQYGG